MATWLDRAGDWVADIFASRDAAPFTPTQTLLLQELLTQTFTRFAKEFGQNIGDQLARVTLESRQLQSQEVAILRSEFETICKSRTSQCEGVTALPQQEMTSDGKFKNRRNVDRKKRRRLVRER